MAHDYRYNAFDDVAEPLAISGEIHIIPSSSPYTIRLCEVPQKTTPSSISLTIAGTAASEVAATPAAGEFWVDYSTGADNDDNWNTGTILFNAADAGKTVVVSYNGMGTLASVDFHGSQLFTASGTFTVPAGVTTVYVSGCGGGGGGSVGGDDGGDSPNYAWSGGGGGAGACALKTGVAVTPGSNITVTIGGGGAAGTTGSGGAGGTTSFGALLSLTGGGGSAFSSNGGTKGASGGSYGGTGGAGQRTSASAGGYPATGGGGLFGAGGGAEANGGGFGSGGGGQGGAGAQGFILVEW